MVTANAPAQLLKADGTPYRVAPVLTDEGVAATVDAAVTNFALSVGELLTAMVATWAKEGLLPDTTAVLFRTERDIDGVLAVAEGEQRGPW